MKDENDVMTVDAYDNDEVMGDNLKITGKRWKGSTTPEDVRSTWSTPSWLYDYLNQKQGPFTLDAAASAENAKCEKFFTKEDDALSLEWPAKEKIWLNPPFSDPRPWILKAIESGNAGSTVCVVLPDDISTKWFRMAVDGAAEMYGLVSDGYNTGRVGYIHPVTGEAVKGNPKGTFIFIFRRHTAPLKTTWLSRHEMEQENSDII